MFEGRSALPFSPPLFRPFGDFIMKHHLALLTWAVLLAAAAPVLAQDAAVEEDLRFVRELRSRHYSDLALKYLDRLAKGAAPELARELPLEYARTHLAVASDEPDSVKRLRLYNDARGELEKFIRENANHPRAAEARLAVAEATVLQGKTQLSRALLQETTEAREDEAIKARTLFDAADKQLRASVEELKKQRDALEPKTPAEQASARKLERAVKQAELAVALNVFDQAMSYVNEGKEGQDKLRADKVQEAEKLLEKLAGGELNDPVTWEAEAWVGRCQDQLGDPQKAIKTYDLILTASGPAAFTGQRLARYFKLLAIEQTVEPALKKQVPTIILSDTQRWLREYGAYGQTPEAHGVRYLRARYLLEQAEANKTPAVQGPLLREARQLLGQIERTENDYTDRAKRLKLVAINKQGGFSKKVEALDSFEDCYVRAQYEAMQMGEDAKNTKLQGEELEKKRKAHVTTLIKALERGLKLPDAKSFPIELNTARVMLTFFCMESQEYQKAIDVGEHFARNDPRSSQAAMAAVYALQGYTDLIKQREKEDATDEARALRERMYALAEYMIGRWPNELAGNMARHELALRALREEKFAEGIQALAAITPDYRSYSYVQYQMASAALIADKNNAPLIAGDKPGAYRQRALAALERIPEPPTGTSPFLQNIYAQAKVLLGFQLFRDKKFKETRALAAHIKQKLPQLKLDDNGGTDSKLRGELLEKLSHQELLATWGEADIAFKAGKHDQVATLLDPLVAEFNTGKLDAMKTHLEVGMPLMSMALQSNVQLGRVDQASKVLEALQTLQAEKGGEKGVDTILQQLAVVIRKQVDELQKKKSEAELKKAVAGYKTLIQNVVQTQKNPTTRIMMLLAQCYSGMGEHQEAVKVLDKIKAPKDYSDDPAKDSPEVREYRGTRLLLVKELRKTGDTDYVKKAGDMLEEMIGKPDKPGWGRKSIDVLIEQVCVFEESKEYARGATMANSLVRMLLKKASDNAWQEKYFECYYHQVYCMAKFAADQSDGVKKEKGLRDAAQLIVQLEKKWEAYATSPTRKRFEDLLAGEPGLKEEYTKIKGE
jgi:hypothetical protein